jgi:hypothetical protein
MKIIYLYVFLAFGVYACTPVIVTNGIKRHWSADYMWDTPGGIAFIQHQDSIPAAAIHLATTTIRIPDIIGGLPDGLYYLQTRRLVLLEAKRLGGNLVRLVRVPNSANRLEAEIYRITGPLPERPRPGKCLLFVTTNNPSAVQGDLLFNDSVLASYPGTRKSVQEFKVDTGGFLTFREADASLGTSVYLPYAGTYDIFIGFDRLHRPNFGVAPWDMYFSRNYPDTFLNKAQYIKPELSPALTDSPSSFGNTAVVRLRGHFPRGLKGGIYFNGVPLLLFPITVPQKGYKFMFHENGIITYREAGSFAVESIFIEKGQEYILKIKRAVAEVGADLKVLDQHSVLQ